MKQNNPKQLYLFPPIPPNRKPLHLKGPTPTNYLTELPMASRNPAAIRLMCRSHKEPLWYIEDAAEHTPFLERTNKPGVFVINVEGYGCRSCGRSHIASDDYTSALHVIQFVRAKSVGVNDTHVPHNYWYENLL